MAVEHQPLAQVPEFDEDEIDTILAEDIDFEGELTFSKPLMIKGKFTVKLSRLVICT